MEAVYALWLREVIIFFREKERLIGAIITPLLWIFAFGAGLGASINIAGMNYQQFVFPGIVAMSVLFVSIFYGMYIIWDRKLDFLKEVLVAPVPRHGVFLGKMLGGMTDSFVQALIILIIGFFLSFVPNPYTFVIAMLAIMLLSMSMVSLGLIIGSTLKTPEGFNLVMSFVMWPMFMLSGALFPVQNLPTYLDILVKINPMTYGVDLLRFALFGTTGFGVLVDVGVLLFVTVVFVAIGTQSFERMQV